MKKYLLGVLLLLLLVVTPVSTQAAATVAELQTLIAQLQAQIAVILSGQTAPICQLTRDLSFDDGYSNGLSGQVSILQQKLIFGGYLKIIKPTGWFGNMTVAAIKQWQGANGLAINGQIGPNDRAVFCGNRPVPACNTAVTCLAGQQTVLDRYENNCPIFHCAGGNNPVINSVSGPTSLQVGQQGTWAVNVTASANSQLTYDVNWGDFGAGYAGISSAGSPFVQNTGTFTHSYSQAGTYTVTFSVSASALQLCKMAPCPDYYLLGTTKTSLTVVVGGVANRNLPITYSADPANWHDFAGEPYSKTFSVAISQKDNRVYSWSISNGSLPPGLTLLRGLPCYTNQPCARPVAENQIVVYGTPTQPGNFPFTLMVRDDLGNTGSLNLNINIEGNMRALKPVIYLYPQKIQSTKVQLDYAGTLFADYPAYDTKIGGWNVTAYPDGKIINSADGKEYSYLFWEGNDYNKTDYDLTTGFVVKGSDSLEFLQSTLSQMGLTPKEYNEFIVYWYPKMKDNAYNLVHFAGQEYTDKAKLTITPKPDSVLRVFMVFKPLNQAVKVVPQTIKSFERQGFTVVEWGGTELSK